MRTFEVESNAYQEAGKPNNSPQIFNLPTIFIPLFIFRKKTQFINVYSHRQWNEQYGAEKIPDREKLNKHYNV